MVTVAQLMSWLRQFPPGAIAYGYEGIFPLEAPSSIVVVSPETFVQVGLIDTHLPKSQ